MGKFTSKSQNESVAENKMPYGTHWSGAVTFLFALVFSDTNLRIFPWGEL